jgi:hypothetical protein
MSSLDYAVTPVDIGPAAVGLCGALIHPARARSRNTGRPRRPVQFLACVIILQQLGIPTVVARAALRPLPFPRGITKLHGDSIQRSLGVRLHIGGDRGREAARTRRVPFGRIGASLHSQEAQIRLVCLSHRGARYTVHVHCRKLREELFRRMGEDATYQVDALSADNRVPKVQLQAIAKGPVQRALQEASLYSYFL